MNDSQHLGMLRISGVLMRDYLLQTSEPGHWFCVQGGIPPDAEFVRMWIDEERNTICLVYRHPSFPKCYPGEPVFELRSPPMHAALYGDVICNDLESGRIGVPELREMMGVSAKEVEPPTFTPVTLTVKESPGFSFPASKEYAEAIDVERMMDDAFHEKFNEVLKRESMKLEQQILHGTGKQVPQGIINADDADEPHIAQG